MESFISGHKDPSSLNNYCSTNSMNQKVAMALTMQGGQSKQQAEFSTEQLSEISNRIEKGKLFNWKLSFHLILENLFFL